MTTNECWGRTAGGIRRILWFDSEFERENSHRDLPRKAGSIISTRGAVNAITSVKLASALESELWLQSRESVIGHGKLAAIQNHLV